MSLVLVDPASGYLVNMSSWLLIGMIDTGSNSHKGIKEFFDKIEVHVLIEL